MNSTVPHLWSLAQKSAEGRLVKEAQGHLLAQDFAGGVDPFGAWTSSYGQQAEQRGESERRHLTRQAVATAGGVLGGGLLVPSAISGVTGGIRGLVSTQGGVGRRFVGAANEALQGFRQPVEAVYRGRKALGTLRRVSASPTPVQVVGPERANLDYMARNARVGLDSVSPTAGGQALGSSRSRAQTVYDLRKFRRSGELTPAAAQALTGPVTEGLRDGQSQLALGGVVGGVSAAVQYQKGRSSERDFQGRLQKQKVAYLTASHQSKKLSRKLMHGMLELLLAQYLLYYELHWKYRTHYGDHLVFERLYKAVQKELDGLAEKLIGYHGASHLELVDLIDGANKFIKKWTTGNEDYLGQALEAEKTLQSTFHSCYKALKEMDVLPMGLDDFIMSVCNDHETHTYLLQQVRAGRVKEKTAMPTSSQILKGLGLTAGAAGVGGAGYYAGHRSGMARDAETPYSPKHMQFAYVKGQQDLAQRLRAAVEARRGGKEKKASLEDRVLLAAFEDELGRIYGE